MMRPCLSQQCPRSSPTSTHPGLCSPRSWWRKVIWHHARVRPGMGGPAASGSSGLVPNILIAQRRKQTWIQRCPESLQQMCGQLSGSKVSLLSPGAICPTEFSPLRAPLTLFPVGKVWDLFVLKTQGSPHAFSIFGNFLDASICLRSHFGRTFPG